MTETSNPTQDWWLVVFEKPVGPGGLMRDLVRESQIFPSFHSSLLYKMKTDELLQNESKRVVT